MGVTSLWLEKKPCTVKVNNGPRMCFFISFFGVNETIELIKEKIK